MISGDGYLNSYPEHNASRPDCMYTIIQVRCESYYWGYTGIVRHDRNSAVLSTKVIVSTSGNI
jgi:hypothetical protein